MPLARAWMGLWKWQTSPSTRTSPSVGGKFPAISLTRVDLPAPLSPINPTTSPGSTDQLMSFTAWIAPKLFDTLRTSSRATLMPPWYAALLAALVQLFIIDYKICCLLLDRRPGLKFG